MFSLKHSPNTNSNYTIIHTSTHTQTNTYLYMCVGVGVYAGIFERVYVSFCLCVFVCVCLCMYIQLYKFSATTQRLPALRPERTERAVRQRRRSHRRRPYQERPVTSSVPHAGRSPRARTSEENIGCAEEEERTRKKDGAKTEK